MNRKKVYTVVCPGRARYDESQIGKMPKDDKRLHGGGGWYSEVFPTTCPQCGDAAQPRDMYWEVDLTEGESDDQV